MQARFEDTRFAAHPKCVLCSPSREPGLGVEFELLEDGSVAAEFACSRRFEGYPDVLHGGLISLLLDGAMTNCVFAQGSAAYTAEMHVRFRHPVSVGEPATIHAWMDGSSPRLRVVKSEMTQGGQVKATAVGKFMPRRRQRE